MTEEQIRAYLSGSGPKTNFVNELGMSYTDLAAQLGIDLTMPGALDILGAAANAVQGGASIDALRATIAGGSASFSRDPSQPIEYSFGAPGNISDNILSRGYLVPNGANPLAYSIGGENTGVAFSPEILDAVNHSMQVKDQQGLARIAALIAGGAALGAAGGGVSTGATTAAGLPTGAGVAAPPLTGGAVGAGTGAVTAAGLPTGSAAAAGGGLGTFSGAGAPAAGASPGLAGGSGMDWSLIANIGSSLLSGLLGAKSNKDAVAAQTGANQSAIDEQRREFDTILGLTAPYREAGGSALSAIRGLLGLPGGDAAAGESAFNSIAGLPGTQLAVDDTLRGVRNAYGASGSTGGNVLQALTDRITGLTGDRVYNSLFQLAGFGPGATSTAANAASTSGANIGNLLTNTGIANASGILGTGQSWNNSLQNIMPALLDYLRNRQGTGA
jgi:hypothetical protein